MFKLIGRIFKIAGRKKRALKIAVFVNIMEAFCTGGTYIAVLFAINCIIARKFGEKELLYYSLIMVALILVRYILEYAVNSLQSSAGYELMRDVRVKETSRISTLPLGTFQHEGTGKLTAIFTSDMTYVEMYCVNTSSKFIAGMSVVICTSIVMLIVDWRMALCAMVGFIPAWFVYKDAKNKFRAAGEKRQEEGQKCIGSVLEYVSGMETIRSYRLTDRIYHKIEDSLLQYKEASSAYEIKAMLPMMGYQLLVRLGMGLIFICGLVFYFAGMTSLTAFLFFTVISASYYQPVEALLLEFGTLNLMDISLDHMKELHEKKPLPNKGIESISSNEIKANHVSFSYENTDSFAVEDFTACFVPNGLTAVVGPSGSGKSTLLMLIARFWDVKNGSLSIGGKDVRKTPYQELLGNISMVFQDVYLFVGTIADNIRMGNRRADDESVIAAAKAACCHEFITALPHGYNTVVGEGGCTLSGGEKQRISIARAILKDAPVVLLDEALSSIDPENAYKIQQGIDHLTEGKTVVMIAHTLSHIRHADRILVMEKGRLKEMGTHDDLLAKEGLYQEMWEKENAMKSWKIDV